MDYLMLTVSATLLGIDFSLQKLYQKFEKRGIGVLNYGFFKG